MCVTWKSCIFERKIQCRVKISSHCRNVKHRWVRFSFSPARAWRGTNLCSSLWRFVNSLPFSALLLLKSSSCVEIVAESNSYRSALFRRDRLQPQTGKQCTAPLLWLGLCREKKGGRGRERTRERFGRLTCQAAVSLFSARDVLREASWNSNWAHYGHRLE